MQSNTRIFYNNRLNSPLPKDKNHLIVSITKILNHYFFCKCSKTKNKMTSK